MADTTTRSTNIEELLAPLRKSILQPHYISGKLEPPASSFTLFYKLTKGGTAARHIDLANATLNDLSQLAQACQPASLGVVQEDATDEFCHNVGTIDPECFVPRLALDQTGLMKFIGDYVFEDDQSTKIKMELRGLNVYTQGSFSKPRIVTPRGENMFGSLVIVFPTPHEGGALLARHRGKEWTFDPAWEMTKARAPAIGYAVLLNDVEHEVTPITSGHRVTLTYDLYRNADSSASAQDSAEPFSLPAHERTFRESFEALLENLEFLPYGGALGFGLRHRYPVAARQIRHVYSLLKANDAVVYRSLRALGFQPALYFYHEWERTPVYLYDDTIEGGLIDDVLEFKEFDEEADQSEAVDISLEIVKEGGHIVCYDDSYRAEEYAYHNAETMVWATPLATFNTQETDYTFFYGNEPIAEVAYWDLCLVVRIGKAGERLMYPTLSQLKKVLRRDDRRSPFWERDRI